MTLIVDIDDTLILYEDNSLKCLEKYKTGKPNVEEIELLNFFHDAGYNIILHTGRNWDKYNFTKKQMKKFGVKYHELVMGKPQGIYIDRDSIQSLKDLR